MLESGELSLRMEKKTLSVQDRLLMLLSIGLTVIDMFRIRVLKFKNEKRVYSALRLTIAQMLTFCFVMSSSDVVLLFYFNNRINPIELILEINCWENEKLAWHCI